MNRGLILISPIILVRLLTVTDYGRYREFLIYAMLLTGIGTSGINSSLLRFIPHQPELGWQFVNQSIAMTAATSFALSAVVLTLNSIFDGWLIPEYGLLVVVYSFLFVNFDFWEYLWIAEQRPLLIWRYSTGRLVARILVVTIAAALTRDLDVIVWSLVILETIRIIAAMFAWHRRDRQSSLHGFGPGLWRERVRYSLPFGVALALVTLNKQMGNLFVAKMMGPIALAHYAIGTYAQPITMVMRNSLSDVLLGEMAKRERDTQADRLLLFRRTTVVTAIFLVPCGILLARFAEIIVVTLFSDEYRPAVLIFQIYAVVLLRDIVDFGVPLRAINVTAPIMHSNLIAIIINGLLLLVLLPTLGLVGAVLAFVISRLLEGWYLGVQIMRTYNAALSELASWTDLLKIAAAGALAALLLYGSFWTQTLGLFGVLAGSVLYLLAFVYLLWQLRIPEASLLLRQVRGYSRSLLTRLQS
jgi:O-antigen/teichoic acid export membrane protein